MEKLIVHPSSTSEWQALITDASNSCSISLTEEIESYLVFLLMRYTKSPDIANSVVALEFLNSTNQLGKQKSESLRDVGDRCLLFSGLFPGRAKKRRIKISYFVKIGQSAYCSLSEQPSSSLAELYSKLSEQFIPMMDILHSTREIHSQYLTLDPLQAEEIWNDTGSPHAFNTLRKFTNATPINNHQSLSQLRH